MASGKAARPTEITLALRRARRLIRWQRFWRALGTLLAPVLFIVAAWFGLTRFTLLDLPAWPPLAVLVGALLAVALYARLTPVTTPEAARFTDHALGLDGAVFECLGMSVGRDSGR